MGEKLPNRGTYILVIDPSQTVGLDEFRAQVEAYISNIKNSKALPGQKIRIPGQQATEKANKVIKDDEIDIPGALWSELQELAENR